MTDADTPQDLPVSAEQQAAPVEVAAPVQQAEAPAEIRIPEPVQPQVTAQGLNELYREAQTTGISDQRYAQLEQQGRIRTLAEGDDPFSNPLLFLVPVLFCFALGLIGIRIFPWIVNLLARLAAFQPSTVLLITLRRLGRAAGQYTGSMM